MSDQIVMLSLVRVEAHHLNAIVRQFLELLEESAPGDPAVARLTPSPYPDDPDAGAAFSEQTTRDLLDRRGVDARTVLHSLIPFTDAPGDEDATAPADIVIPDADLDAWLRTLAALRLVIAVRLGIAQDDAHDPDDPRYAVYDWLGYRLEGLTQIAEQRDAL